MKDYIAVIHLKGLLGLLFLTITVQAFALRLLRTYILSVNGQILKWYIDKWIVL